MTNLSATLPCAVQTEKKGLDRLDAGVMLLCFLVLCAPYLVNDLVIRLAGALILLLAIRKFQQVSSQSAPDRSRLSLLNDSLMIAFGISTILFPTFSLSLLAFLTGPYFLLLGTWKLLTPLWMKSTKERIYSLADGIILLILGLIVSSYHPLIEAVGSVHETRSHFSVTHSC